MVTWPAAIGALILSVLLALLWRHVTRRTARLVDRLADPEPTYDERVEEGRRRVRARLDAEDAKRGPAMVYRLDDHRRDRDESA